MESLLLIVVGRWWYDLSPLQVKTAPAPEVEAFTMKEALDEKFFSDLTVRSSDGVTFNIHRTVLDCCSPNMGYREWEMYLSTLKATLLKVTLKSVQSCVYK